MVITEVPAEENRVSIEAGNVSFKERLAVPIQRNDQTARGYTPRDLPARPVSPSPPSEKKTSQAIPVIGGILLLLALAKICHPDGKQGKGSGNVNPQVPSVGAATVTSPGGLFLRATPSTGGQPIILMPSGGNVTVQNCNAQVEQIDGIESRWCSITYGGFSGWAFGGYLR